MALDLTKPVKRRPGAPCVLERVAAEHGPDTAAQIMAAIRNPEWSAQALADSLAAQGIPGFSQQIVQNHRSEACVSCRDAGRYQP